LETSRESHLVSYAGFNGIKAIDTPWYPSLKKAIIGYVTTQKLKHLTIIGHSMGGDLAIDIAASLPDYVDKLILVDALPCMRAVMIPGAKSGDIQYNSPYNKQLLAMKEEPFKKSAAMMAGGMTLTKSKMETLTNWIIEADRKTYVYGYTDLLKLDLRDTLTNVKAKTLILGASFPNVEMVNKTFGEQYARLENKTIEIANDSKHFVMFDQPDWFYQQVNAFLAK
jgi:pimeloyl-ACP methyl ester carboxylesterase